MIFKKLFIISLLILIAFLPRIICLVYADTQSDVSAEEAVSIIKDYEKACMNKDLNKMIEYVDQNSDRFKKGFLEEFKTIFKYFSNVRLYHFDKKKVFYIADGVEVLQNTVYVAYSPSLIDIHELVENYYLKKIDGKYKIADYFRLGKEDIDLDDKGTEAMLKNDVENALLHFKNALEINQQNSAAHFRLGMIYSKTGKPQEAIRELEKAVTLRPKVGFYRFYLSQGYYALDDKEKAAEEMEKAIMLDPGLEIFFDKENKK